MCGTCGCGDHTISIEDHSGHRHHNHGDTRTIAVEKAVLSRNDEQADINRRFLSGRGIFTLNLVSSPGSGKTTLLVETINALQHRLHTAVIEGDQQTSYDAERIRSTGSETVQINTGKGCHLDAVMIDRALQRLPLPEQSILFIENVGNLVCPAAFDLGEAHKAVILSVTEGEDKPVKYPDMFYAADVMVLNKIDLLPYVNFDVERCFHFARKANPRLAMIQVSATTGQGMDSWLNWVCRRRDAFVQHNTDLTQQA